MSMHRMGLTLFAVVCAGALGCGDDDDDGDSSGVDGSKVGQDLSDDEAHKLCDHIVSSLDIEVSVEEQCTVNAAVQTEDEAACEPAVQACIDANEEIDDEEEPDDEEDDDCDDAAEDLEDCTATVDQIEGCFNAIARTVEDLSNTSCADAEALTLDNAFVDPSECDVITEKCAGVLSD